MPFLKLVAPEADLGRWIDVGIHPDNQRPVRLKVRRIPDKVDMHIANSYGTAEKVTSPVKTTNPDGTRVEYTRVTKQRVYDFADNCAIFRDRCEYAVLDSENLDATAVDEPMAKLLASLLGGGVEVRVGDTIPFDGRLTSALKHHVFDNDWQFAKQVSEKVAEAYSSGLREKEAFLPRT
jgi:hypothetical protein